MPPPSMRSDNPHLMAEVGQGAGKMVNDELASTENRQKAMGVKYYVHKTVRVETPNHADRKNRRSS